MSNWYNTVSDAVWFSADEVDAWNPSGGREKETPLKGLKHPKSTPGTTSTSVPTDSIKFFELSTNVAPNQGAWDAFVMTEQPKLSSKKHSGNSEAVLVDPTHTSTKISPKATEKGEPRGAGFPKDFQPSKHRNIDIEVELNQQNLYKTELCQSWGESGTCRYGSKCQFAHGKQELRPVLRHPKYKTEICKTFHNTGTCPYGKRCRFVHHVVETQSPSSEVDNLEVSLPATPDEATVEIQRKLNELNLSLLAPDPVFVLEVEREGVTAVGGVKKGSRLPFFQKLRKQKW